MLHKVMTGSSGVSDPPEAGADVRPCEYVKGDFAKNSHISSHFV